MNTATLNDPMTTALDESVTIKVNDLNFFYGSFQGLKNIQLDVYDKKVTAFIGPSGCGKSTLLRTLNRMYDLYPGQRAEGSIVYKGRNILDKDVDVNVLRAKIGMVFQKPTPFPMSIYENIAFGVRLYENLPKGEMDERVEWALNKAAIWTEVKDKLQKSGLSLSGGQQQRLCIARAVAVKPDVLLLDEPLSGLDSALHARLLADLSALLRARGTTTLHVTHNRAEAEAIADRVVEITGLNSNQS